MPREAYQKEHSETTLSCHFLPTGNGGRAPRGSRLIPPRGAKWPTTGLQVTEWPVGYPLALSGKNRTEVHSVGPNTTAFMRYGAIRACERCKTQKPAKRRDVSDGVEPAWYAFSGLVRGRAPAIIKAGC